MNLREILTESTYPIGHIIDEIYKDKIKPLLSKFKAKKLVETKIEDITDYLRDFIEKYNVPSRYYITLTFNKREKQGSNWAIFAKKDKPEMRIALHMGENIIYSLDLKKLRDLLRGFLAHEITHVIDYLRTSGKSVKNSATDLETPEGMAYYVSSSDEFNAFFHQLKTDILSHRKIWNKISNRNQLKNFLLYNLPLERISEKAPEKYANIEKMILKKLAREKLLPKGLIS